MGGVRFLSFFAAEKTLSFLAKRQVKTWVLIDRDEKDAVDVDSLRSTMGGRSNIAVLNRRELENYLICPRAILEFIRLKHELSGSPPPDPLPTESEIQDSINEFANKLKTFTIQKRVHKYLSKPVYPAFEAVSNDAQERDILNSVECELGRQEQLVRDAKAQIQEVYEREKRILEESWERNKLDKVPGDMLLDMVCSKYGVRFKKERDGLRLAALLTKDEIAGDIKAIVEEIGRP